MARHGMARHGEAGLGKARHGEARQGKARQAIFSTEEQTMTVIENKPTDTITRKVTLCGIKPIMFDRYAGDNSTKLEPSQKLYLAPTIASELPVIGLPSANIMSFLSAHNTNSAPKRLRDKRKYKDVANACLSFADILEDFIPILRDGRPLRFGAFVDDVDKSSGAYIHRSVARLDKGIPNPKIRPVVPCPWGMIFTLKIRPNREIKEQEIMNLIVEGGLALGLGTFRGVFGKFEVTGWE